MKTSLMNTTIIPLDFSALWSCHNTVALLNRLNICHTNNHKHQLKSEHTHLDDITINTLKQQWRILKHIDNHTESAMTDWLITLFDTLFIKHNVRLVRGKYEPEYFPASHNQPARIEFAHGFFASALHEISHWCIAGKTRRQLPDFGYWYAPDGRNAAQQQAFERTEIKPQAIECLFTLACQRQFQVSQDNLFADFDTSTSTFSDDVYQQAQLYITSPHTLPRDAQSLLQALLMIC